MIALSMPEVFDACSLLFGPQVEVSLHFLKYLELSGLRSAYRKKALETHPDRAKALGKDKAQMNECFREATLAYEKLIPIVANKGGVLLRGQPGDNIRVEKDIAKQRAKTDFPDLFYGKEIPKRELLFGQFLYYSGLISWKTLINSLTWQRRQRPPIGQIALGWKMISRKDIQRILTCRDFRGKFGERAIHLGYLSPFQLMALLGKQRSLQCPIGEYFVNEGILPHKELENMVRRQKIHNRSVCTRSTR